MNNEPKVPSVKSYSRPKNGEKQWGKDLSEKAVTMILTKLELDVQDNKTDELELILMALEGMKNLKFSHVKQARGDPEYTTKSPEQVATDYLTEIYKVLHKELQRRYGPDIVARLPVDIVITVPVVSYVLV